MILKNIFLLLHVALSFHHSSIIPELCCQAIGRQAADMLCIAGMRWIGQEKEWEEGEVWTYLLSLNSLHKDFFRWLYRLSDLQHQEERYKYVVWGNSCSLHVTGWQWEHHELQSWWNRPGKHQPQVRLNCVEKEMQGCWWQGSPPPQG